MFHTTKYELEDLMGMKNKVSTVKGTKEGKVQTERGVSGFRSFHHFMGSSKESEHDDI